MKRKNEDVAEEKRKNDNSPDRIPWLTPERAAEEGTRAARYIWQDRRAIVFAILVTAAIALFVANRYQWGAAPESANPDFPRQVPTVAPTQTVIAVTPQWFSLHEWMSISQAAALRERENVVNLALLKDNGATWYSRNSSIPFSEEVWEQAVRPSGVSISVDVTSVSIVKQEHTYVVNVFQPFVLESDPQMVYLIDPERNMWSIRFNSEAMESASAVAEGLPLTLPTNRNLSITY